jgi:hypothetical protein
MKIHPYLVGVLFGDGTSYKGIQGAYAVWIDQTDRNRAILESEVVPRFRRMGFRVYFYKYYARSDRTFKWRALVYSKELYTTIRETTGRITEYFNSLSDKDARRFIAGFFDAEGTMTDRIVMYNQHLRLLQAMKTRLGNLGVRYAYIYRFGSVYGLQIYRKESQRRFLELVPSHRLKVYLPG